MCFSGGYDSMCLLHSLKQIIPQNRIVAIHLNHNWRGEESNQEEENCRNFCSEIGVEFYSENFLLIFRTQKQPPEKQDMNF